MTRGGAAARVTPLILTFNEEPNIGRTLDALRWARRVVVLDSGSTDATEQMARSHPNVDWRVRRFDCHQAQWEFGVRQTQMDSDYVLALDADMVAPPEFLGELEQRFLSSGLGGAVLRFRYLVGGRFLPGSIYPPQLRLFRPHQVRVLQVGHTQRFEMDGPLYQFHARVWHDDRKPLERWVQSQLRYVALEAGRILESDGAGWKDRIRRCGLAPAVVGLTAYVRAGGPFTGRAAYRYALERMMFETLLAARLMDVQKPRTDGA